MSPLPIVAETSFRGGARIGWFNATWPFARLTVSADRVVLSCFRTLHFTAHDIESFQNYGSIPWVWYGIRIRHRRSDLPNKIVFWYLGDRDDIRLALRAHGFAATIA